MASKQEQLREINIQRKELADKQKALRESLNETKEERKSARKVQAQCRKDVRGEKAYIRELTAKVYDTFTHGTIEDVQAIANEITEASAKLADTIQKFAQASIDMEEL